MTSTTALLDFTDSLDMSIEEKQLAARMGTAMAVVMEVMMKQAALSGQLDKGRTDIVAQSACAMLLKAWMNVEQRRSMTDRLVPVVKDMIAAVNSHDALLAALKESKYWLRGPSIKRPGYERVCETVEDAEAMIDAAIAKAST